jgi:hypothetical protein
MVCDIMSDGLLLWLHWWIAGREWPTVLMLVCYALVCSSVMLALWQHQYEVPFGRTYTYCYLFVYTLLSMTNAHLIERENARLLIAARWSRLSDSQPAGRSQPSVHRHQTMYTRFTLDTQLMRTLLFKLTEEKLDTNMMNHTRLDKISKFFGAEIVRLQREQTACFSNLVLLADGSHELLFGSYSVIDLLDSEPNSWIWLAR